MNTVQSSEFDVISLNQMRSRMERPDFSILRLDLAFNPEDLQAALKKVESNYPLRIKDDVPRYGGLGLQYTDPQNRFGDAVDSLTSTFVTSSDSKKLEHTVHRKLRVFPYFNEAAQPFRFVFDRILPIQVFRTRLLRALPGFEMTKPHIDGRHGFRLHIPIETAPEAWIEVAGVRSHLAADGSVYLLNTSRPHRVGNPGGKNRTHLTMVLWEPSFYQIPQVFFNRLILYFDHYGLDMDQLPSMREKLTQKVGAACALCGCNHGNAMMPICFSKIPDEILVGPERHFKYCCAVCLTDLAREKAISTVSEQADLDVHFGTDR